MVSIKAATSELGYFRPINDVCAMCAFHPIATKLLHYGSDVTGQLRRFAPQKNREPFRCPNRARMRRIAKISTRSLGTKDRVKVVRGGASSNLPGDLFQEMLQAAISLSVGGVGRLLRHLISSVPVFADKLLRVLPDRLFHFCFPTNEGGETYTSDAGHRRYGRHKSFDPRAALKRINLPLGHLTRWEPTVLTVNPRTCQGRGSAAK
jgi:hypothetical protein